MIMEFVKKHEVPIRRMEKLCHAYHVQCKFLAPYWSPTNPQEYIWAYMKEKIRSMNPNLPIETRIDQAWASVTPEFVHECIDRSIRSCSCSFYILSCARFGSEAFKCWAEFLTTKTKSPGKYRWCNVEGNFVLPLASTSEFRLLTRAASPLELCAVGLWKLSDRSRAPGILRGSCRQLPRSSQDSQDPLA